MQNPTQKQHNKNPHENSQKKITKEVSKPPPQNQTQNLK